GTHWRKEGVVGVQVHDVNEVRHHDLPAAPNDEHVLVIRVGRLEAQVVAGNDQDAVGLGPGVLDQYLVVDDRVCVGKLEQLLVPVGEVLLDAARDYNLPQLAPTLEPPTPRHGLNRPQHTPTHPPP